MTAEFNSRPARYRELLQAAAERHHTTITDTRAVYEAGLILAHEDQTAQMVAGEKIDIATYLRLGEELAKLIPPPEPVKVTIHLVDPDGTSREIMDGKPVPDATAPIDAVAEPSAPIEPDVETEAPVKPAAAAAPVPARPAPPIPVPVNPPPKPVQNLATAEWERQRGYGRSARDGGLIKGAAVPHQDPNLTGVASGRYENYNNSAPSCWTGYQNRPNVVTEPDVHPYKNSDGSPRVPHKAPY